MFALGYAIAEVKKLLKPYCAQQKRISKHLQRKAQQETEQAETHLSEELYINDCTEVALLSLREQKEGIYLEFDFGETLFVEDGKIIEKELEKIYPYDESTPVSALTIIRAVELYYIDKKFELHFLVENISKENKSKLGYLTIRGVNIKGIVS